MACNVGHFFFGLCCRGWKRGGGEMRGLCKISHPERRSQPKRGGGEGEDFEYTSHYIPPPSSIAVHGGKKSGGKNDCSSSSFSAAPRYSTTLSGRGGEETRFKSQGIKSPPPRCDIVESTTPPPRKKGKQQSVQVRQVSLSLVHNGFLHFFPHKKRLVIL